MKQAARRLRSWLIFDVGRKKMIAWDKERVAGFLKAPAISRHSEPTEFVIAFPVKSARAELCVRPFDDHVSLSLRSSHDEVALWSHACSRIEVHEAEEDGPCVIIEAPVSDTRLRSWIAITRENGSFAIFTSSVVLPSK